jgi:hypothetical protein
MVCTYASEVVYKYAFLSLVNVPKMELHSVLCTAENCKVGGII